jgi:hypothetical protein
VVIVSPSFLSVAGSNAVAVIDKSALATLA